MPNLSAGQQPYNKKETKKNNHEQGRKIGNAWRTASILGLAAFCCVVVVDV
jgi:hypothetical protein